MIALILTLAIEVAQQNAAPVSATKFLAPVICGPEPEVTYRPPFDSVSTTLAGRTHNPSATIIVTVTKSGAVESVDIERSSSDRTIDKAVQSWALRHVFAANGCGGQERFMVRIPVKLDGDA